MKKVKYLRNIIIFVKKTKNMTKKYFLISFFVLFCFFSCKKQTEKSTVIKSPTPIKNITINIDSFKTASHFSKGYYTTPDSSVFGLKVFFSYQKYGVNITIYFSQMQSFKKQLEDLKQIVELASKEFNLNLLRTMSFGSVGLCDDFIYGFSSIPEVRQHIDSCVQNGYHCCNYMYLSQFFEKYDNFNAIIEIFNEYPLEIESVSAEKCGYIEIKYLDHLFIEPDKNIKNVVGCGLLYVKLKEKETD